MSTSWQRRAATRPKAVEATTLVVLCALTVASVLVTRAVMPETPELWPAVATAVVACAALRRRRDHPLPVLAVTLLCTMAQGALGYLLTPGLMGPLLCAQYSISVRSPRRATWNSALTAAAGIAVTGLFTPAFHDSPMLAVVNPAAWVLLSAAFGAYVRVRREYAAARAEHADRQREEEARHRVIQERMRIARELHDVVAHHLTLADAQAGTAAHLARADPGKALEIIGRLPETTAAALRELKATVGLLREDTDPTDDLTPAPGLGRLPDLVESCSAAGLEVTVTVEGPARPLTPVLDLTAYRIVQEALTNVSKHAATRSARVRVAYTPDHLTLTVTNDTVPGRPAPAPGPRPGRGFGLLGMRERTSAAGGTFHAGRRPQGGFEVACTLPLGRPHESPAS
ncbi:MULTISPECIES: sensor histidine kinase [unclassified Streptomyces]|uniref:sensor histidine kinase n=1 Tax=unclassified Streptomyces TaxID=2593676 RepID=UPI00070A6822|nr:sensor histidine kinase [Streptomyces sp. Root1310]KQX63387.1 ATPase [Streptomyces sp. Root1310]